MRENFTHWSRRGKLFCEFAVISRKNPVGTGAAKRIFRNPIDSLRDYSKVRQLSPDENNKN
jgi:hypothetical protein